MTGSGWANSKGDCVDPAHLRRMLGCIGLVAALMLVGIGTALDGKDAGGSRHEVGLPESAADGANAAELKVSLVAESPVIVPGQPLVLGVRFELRPGWHLYWRNPGDSGMPPRFRFGLPEGWSAGEVGWPLPARLSGAGEAIYGYEGDVLFPVTVTGPANLPHGELRLGVTVDGLLCDDHTCVPFKREAAVTLPVASDSAASSQPDPRWQQRFAETRRRLPLIDPAWRLRARPGEGRQLRLEIEPPSGRRMPATVTFFPLLSDVVRASGDQTFVPASADRPATLIVERGFAEPGSVLEGVLVAPGGFGPEAVTGVGALAASFPIELR